MNSRKLFFRAIVAVVVIGALYRIFNSQTPQLIHLTGRTMGTIGYNVKYVADEEVVSGGAVDSVLEAINLSLSTYISESEISELNRNGRLDHPSDMFLEVLTKSKEINEKTGGTFDPTVGPLVNAWGFGPDKKTHTPDSTEIFGLLQNVGLAKVKIDQGVRMDSGMYLDFSAIAKGYAVDVIGIFLEKHQVTDYMVEIGGEVRARGQNNDGEIWKIGIENPTVKMDEQELLAIVRLQNLSMATSGNYRNYYQKNGRIVAHTIDPRTGYNTHHQLLSASVMAADCMTADAFATGFMVLGKEESIKILESEEGLEAFLIYQDNEGILRSYVTEGLQSLIQLDKTNE